LDLRVVASVEHESFFVVEQRARPFYRIFEFDPESGQDTTVFTVPDDAIIFGLALSPDRSQLAVAYAEDFNLAGSGLWLLQLDSGDFTEVSPQTENVYLADLDFASDGESVLATHIDRSGDDEQLGVAEISTSDGAVAVVTDAGIVPAAGSDGSIYFLETDAEEARRSIGYLDASGQQSTITVEDSSFDLDHLLVDTDGDRIHVAVLDPPDDGLTIGNPAAAHGNHDIASQWWSGTLEDVQSSLASQPQFEPIIVYDATALSDSIVYATSEGLAITSDTRLDLIKSRALRFVAG